MITSVFLAFSHRPTLAHSDSALFKSSCQAPSRSRPLMAFLSTSRTMTNKKGARLSPCSTPARNAQDVKLFTVAIWGHHLGLCSCVHCPEQVRRDTVGLSGSSSWRLCVLSQNTQPFLNQQCIIQPSGCSSPPQLISSGPRSGLMCFSPLESRFGFPSGGSMPCLIRFNIIRYLCCNTGQAERDSE